MLTFEGSETQSGGCYCTYLFIFKPPLLLTKEEVSWHILTTEDSVVVIQSVC